LNFSPLINFNDKKNPPQHADKDFLTENQWTHNKDKSQNKPKQE
jgi:hypothetical protein